MRCVCVGGGPSGLCFALLMKLKDPSHEITVYERNGPDDTFGWGVVFSDQTLDNLAVADPVLAGWITREFIHWDDIETFFKGTVTRTTGHGFVGIGRLHLLKLLQRRAEGLGVDIRFETNIDSIEALSDADLIVASDGINSGIRTRYSDFFDPDIDLRKNKFIWLGTNRLFDAFTFVFEETEHGWIQAHAYRFDENTSTFIVECTEETWRAHGCDGMDSEQSIAFCERIFASSLQGHGLMSNARHMRGREWITFPRVNAGRWHHGNVVLLGDAAHTAHFSIGSGTKLGFEDAIELSNVLHKQDDLEAALVAYEEKRRLDVLRLQSAARNSTEWFENVERYARFDPPQFNYSLLTRSQRVSYENLRLRDPKWLENYETWFTRRATGDDDAPRTTPMFTPFSLREMHLDNRVVVSPMAMYSAEEGTVGDFHLVHLGARALGGAALILTEMTAPVEDGRISPGCAGMYDEAHVDAWKRVVDFVHRESPARIGLQLGHAGPKGSTRVLWEGMDEPLKSGNWPLIGPTAVAYRPGNQVPRAMTVDDMNRVREEFVRATLRAEQVGFDIVELHCAHGYLLSSFITPLLNQRTDEFGGSLANRLRFPIDVFRAMREVWPSQKPMSVRISATDWVEGGVDGAEAVEIARAFQEVGADIINVSAGQTSPDASPVYGRMFQTPFSDRIRNEAQIPTMAVGNIYEVDHVNSIVAAGRADLCCLARPHLVNPNWTLQAAAVQGIATPWPRQYESGAEQLQRTLERAADMAIRIEGNSPEETVKEKDERKQKVDLSGETVHWDLSEDVNYAQYLDLGKILNAQSPQSGQHDETMFIIVHQVSELWIKLALHETGAALELVRDDRLEPAFKMLSRVSHVQRQLARLWDVISTMTPSDYLSFRDALGRASGFQSYQYRILEFTMGNKNAEMANVHRHDAAIFARVEAALNSPSFYDEALRLLARRGFDIPLDIIEREWSQPYQAHPAVESAWLSVYQNTKRHWDLYELAEKMVDVEDNFHQWRFRHMKTVERVIGRKQGTGGTSGVDYLVKALELRFFPELWSLRTSI